jgi:hypothetical protein
MLFLEGVDSLACSMPGNLVLFCDMIGYIYDIFDTNHMATPMPLFKFFIFRKHIRKTRESQTFAYPAYVGSRIAHLPRISNAEAPAIRYTNVGIYE